MAAEIAETGDSFSSSERRRAVCPSLYPASMAIIKTTIVAAKRAQMGTASMLISRSSLYKKPIENHQAASF
jgi:hypothetical protein